MGEFVSLPADKGTNDVAFKYKQFCVLTISKELHFNIYLTKYGRTTNNFFFTCC